MRNKKRKVYADFLRWLEEAPVLEFDFGAVDQIFWKERAVGHFGGAWLQEAETMVTEVRRREERGRKINGKIAEEVTGLSGARLGEFLGGFRRKMGQSLFLFLDSRDESGVRADLSKAWIDAQGSEGSPGEAVAEKILKLLPERQPLLLPGAKSDPEDESE